MSVYQTSAAFPAGITPGNLHKPTLLPVVVMKMSADSKQSSRGATVKPAQPQQQFKSQASKSSCCKLSDR